MSVFHSIPILFFPGSCKDFSSHTVTAELMHWFYGDKVLEQHGIEHTIIFLKRCCFFSLDSALLVSYMRFMYLSIPKLSAQPTMTKISRNVEDAAHHYSTLLKMYCCHLLK